MERLIVNTDEELCKAVLENADGSLDEIIIGADVTLKRLDQVLSDVGRIARRITLDEGFNGCSSYDGIIYTKDGAVLVYCPPARKDSIRVKDGTKRIEKLSICNVEVESMYIPASVETIGGSPLSGGVYYYGPMHSPFSGCKFATVEFGEGTKSIGKYAMAGAAIDEVVLPDGLVTIMDNAFDDCKVKSVNLPGSLESLGKAVFLGCCIDELTVPESVNEIGWMAFGYGTTKRLRLPDSSKIELALYGVADNNYWDKATDWKPTVIEAGWARFAMPSNVHLGRAYDAFKAKCLEGSATEEDFKNAYQLGEMASAKQNAALIQLQFCPDDEEIRKYISGQAKKMAQRYIEKGDVEWLKMLFSTGLMKRPALKELVEMEGINEVCKAYVLDALNNADGKARKSEKL